IAHEYGHFIVEQHNLSHGSFGEGIGDSVASMLYDDPGTGEDFFGPGQGPLRTAEDVINYPCSGPIHTCGQTLSGVWWQIRLGLGDLMGEEAGLSLTQQMYTDWMEITNGGSGNDSAHPVTAIEVLTIDDDDADIDNGTPNFDIICDAFASRNIDCPELNLLSFEYPNGRPDLLVPNAETIIAVNIVGISGDPAPGTGTVSYSIDGGEFTTVAMAEGNPNEYEATLPGLDCVQTLDYYFSVETTGGSQIDDPEGAPNPAFFAVAAEGQEVVVALDFEVNADWTVESDVELFNGAWERAVPAGNGDRGDPLTDFDGSGKCYVTGDGAFEDVSGGATNLRSAQYDLTALADPQVSYARWYSNSSGNFPEADIFVVRVSDDGGMSWVDLEVVGPTGGEVHGGWFVKTFRIADFVDITDQFRILFVASDEGGNSIVEAGIDAFEIFEYLCGGEDCEGDANGDGIVDPLDSGFVLARFGCEVGGGDPSCDAADQNGDGLVDPLDVGFVLARFGPCD
ncbi:MAG: hypothetical protein IID37_05560, partial [Planctomycetes bacterium]|nr:hypothetical protein [Planctomycetota bacterium]